MNEKKRYQRPEMIHVVPYLNGKASSSALQYPLEVKDHIDGVSIKELTVNNGSPLFVFSQKTIREQLENTYTLFKKHYKKVEFSWSYKTNYLKGICSFFHQLGLSAEVVSEMEYLKAVNLGVDPSKIIINGPCKPESLINAAIAGKSLIHIDNFEELLMIKKLSKENGQKAKVGVRVNLNAGIHPQWSRFGFNYELGQSWDAIQMIMKDRDHFDLESLHTHIGTFILDPLAYERAAQKICSLHNEVFEKYKHSISLIDMGGGLPSKSHLKGIFQPPEVAIPALEEYATKITTPLNTLLKTPEKPKLVLESGRHLIDEAGFLITKVVNNKLMPNGVRSYTLDGGVNILYTSTWYNFKKYVDKKVEGLREPAILNGPLCMNIDVLAEDINLPYIESGRHLIFAPVGAYNITQSMQFIHFRPGIVIIDEHGKVHTLKKRETLEDIERGDLVPEGLSFGDD